MPLLFLRAALSWIIRVCSSWASAGSASSPFAERKLPFGTIVRRDFMTSLRLLLLSEVIATAIWTVSVVPGQEAKEPIYEGRSLSQWIKRLADKSPDIRRDAGAA